MSEEIAKTQEGAAAPLALPERPIPPVEEVDRLVVPPAADLASITPQRRWIALCFCISFLVYIGLIPHFLRYSNPPTGDQPLYLMDTISLVQDGDLNVANNYAQHDEDKFYTQAPHPDPYVGLSAPYPLPPQLAVSKNRPPSEQYSWHPPGLGVLLVPAWIAGSWFALWWPATIVFMCLIGALVGVNIFLLAYELTGRLAVAGAIWLPLAFSSPIMDYSLLIFTELPTGLLLIYAFRRLARGWRANSRWQLLLVGTAIATIPWMATRCLPIAGALGLYAAVQWLRDWREKRSAPVGGPRHSISQAFWVLGPGLVLISLLVAYDLFVFGTLWPSPVPGAGAEPPIFYWPWDSGAAPMLFVNGAFALLFDQQWGLLPHAPIYVLAGVGIVAMGGWAGAADRRLLGWMAAVSLPYFALLAAFNFWNGLWCPPARYLATLVPLLGGPLAIGLAALSRSWLYRGIYALLALPGFGYMVLIMGDPRLMFPSDRGYFWSWLATAPESPLHINLRRVLPTFAWPDPLLQPVTTGWIIGAAVLLTLGGTVLLARQPATPRLPRRTRAIHGLVGIVVVGLVGTGWLTINAEYLRHRTMLVEAHRWTLDPPPVQPLGIAYLDGTVFLTDYAQGTLSALDTATGAYHIITPHAARATPAFAHPGDIKVGADGLLYLLNNSDSAPALFVMQPDGEIVRQIPLQGKSPLATGLSFGGNAGIYISDMRSGQVIQYAAGGGPALATLGGPTGGFDNLATVATAPDGTIYASELNKVSIQELDAQGTFVRTYKIDCHAWGAVVHDDWLDVTCEKGLLSLNRTTHLVQTALVAEPGPPLVAPTGLTYAADGTLYIVDRNNLAAYRVQH